MNTRVLEENFPLEVRVLTEIGKLKADEHDNFQNVYRHCLAVGLATEIMRSALELPRIITSAAILHDVMKRLEKQPGAFTEKEATALKAVWKILPADLRHATLPSSRANAHQKCTLRSQILNVADMWTLEDKVVGIERRAEGSKSRWPDVDWDFHIEWCTYLEKKIWEKLVGTEVVKSGPERLLTWVTAQIDNI